MVFGRLAGTNFPLDELDPCDRMHMKIVSTPPHRLHLVSTSCHRVILLFPLSLKLSSLAAVVRASRSKSLLQVDPSSQDVSASQTWI